MREVVEVVAKRSYETPGLTGRPISRRVQARNGLVDRKRTNHGALLPSPRCAWTPYPTNCQQTGSPIREESAGTPSTPAFRGRPDPMRGARPGEQATGAPFATLARGSRRGAEGAADGEGLVRPAASLAAQRSHEAGCLCAVLLPAGRDVSGGYGAGEKGWDFGRYGAKSCTTYWFSLQRTRGGESLGSDLGKGWVEFRRVG